MGLQPHLRAVDTTAVPASEAIHLGGDPSVKGPPHAALCCRLACLPTEDGGNPVRPPAGRDDGRRLGRELQLDVGQPRQRGHRRQPQPLNSTGRHRHPDVTKIKPGRVARPARSTIKNTGDIDGVFSVARTITEDTTGAWPPNPFAAHLNLKIEDITRRRDAALRRPAVRDDRRRAPRTDRRGRRHAHVPVHRDVHDDAAAPPNGADNAFKSAEVEADLQLGGREQLGTRRGTDTMPRSSARRLASMAAGGLGRLVLLAGVLALCATFLPSLLFGYQRYVLVGHSMEPTIHKGSLVFDEIVPVARLRKGDVITYIPPITKEPVSHRIISIDARAARRARVPHPGRQQPRPGPAPLHALASRPRRASRSRSPTSAGCSSCSRCRRRGSS